MKRFRELLRACVDHNGVSITVDHIKAKLLLSNVLRLHQSLTTGSCDQSSNSLCVETRRAESKATIHTISRQFKRLLSDVELTKLDWVTLCLDLVLDKLTLLDKSLKNERQNSILRCGASLLRQLNLFSTHHSEVLLFTIELSNINSFGLAAVIILSVPSLHSCEAKAVLLDNARIQTVEIEQQNDAVIEASFGLKHETTSVLCLLALGSLLASLALFLAIDHLDVVVAKHGLSRLFLAKLLFVRAEEFTTVELVH